MIKKLVQFRKGIYVLLTIECICAFFIALLMKNFTANSIAIYIAIKNIVCAIVLYYMIKIVEENNYSVEDALDYETKNALIFGGIALIKYDENRNIEWVSDLFYEQGLRIVGKKLLEWQPLLAELFEDEDIKTIDINSRKYQVYNSRDRRLLLLKDV
ncbi:MAG: DHH family phosphoesterase, partial [Faecalibacillus sp.]